MAKIKAVGCLSCPLSGCKEQNFIAPVEPENPDLIVLFSTHDKDGNENPDISGILTLIENRFKQGGKKAVILASQNCRGEYSLKSLKACREAYNKPILDRYPEVPVLVLGEKAAHVILGYKAAMIGKNGMAGKVLQLDGHDCCFTYGDMIHQEHIKVMLGSILGVMPEIDWQFGIPPEDFRNSEVIILDIEHTDCNPYLGGKIDCIGISRSNLDKVYCVLPDNYSELISRLSSYSGIIVGHNISSDFVWLVKNGLKFNPELKIWDTMIHRKTRTDAPERGFGLKYLLKQDYQLPGYEAKVHGCWHRNEIPALADLAWYNAVDVVGTKTLFEDQQKDNRNAGTFFLAMDYIIPMVQLMANGIYVSPEKMKELDDGTAEKIEKIKLEIQEIIGIPVAFGNEEEEEE